MVIATVGLPRSGKSTFSKMLQTKYNFVIINRDAIRLELYGQAFFAGGEEYVSAVCNTMIKTLTSQNIDVVIDETHVNEKTQLEHAQASKQPIHWVYFNTSSSCCVQRALDNNQPLLVDVIKVFNRQISIPQNVLAVINKYGKVVTLCNKTRAVCFKDKQLYTYIENDIFLNKSFTKESYATM